jgi:hypothetical protein
MQHNTSNNSVLDRFHLGNTQDSLITPNDVAQLLGVTKGTLQVWRSTGRYNLPYIKIGKKVMYRLSSVLGFIDSRSMDHTGKKSTSHSEGA